MPVDPVPAHEFPGPRYGFGALRCAAERRTATGWRRSTSRPGSRACSAMASASCRRRRKARSRPRSAPSAPRRAITHRSSSTARSRLIPTGLRWPTSSPRTSSGPVARTGRSPRARFATTCCRRWTAPPRRPPAALVRARRPSPVQPRPFISSPTSTHFSSVREREDLVERRVALANQLRAELERYWPGAAVLFKDIDSPISLQFMKRYPTPS